MCSLFDILKATKRAHVQVQWIFIKNIVITFIDFYIFLMHSMFLLTVAMSQNQDNWLGYPIFRAVLYQGHVPEEALICYAFDSNHICKDSILFNFV